MKFIDKTNFLPGDDLKVTVTPRGKSKELESSIEFEHTSKSAIDPEDVIAWLVTQPNANGRLYLESVVRKYMSALRSTPGKLQVPVTLNLRSVFNCHTPYELNDYWDILKDAPNYKQVNRRTSGMFSAGMGCFMRYLQQKTDKLNLKRQGVVQLSEHRTQTHLLDPTVIESLTGVLSSHFTNGFRLNSSIEIARFRSFVSKDLEEEITLSDEDLKNYISACGITFDGKVYVVLAQVKERIRDIAKEYFAQGAQVIFFAEFYAKNENWLFEASVVSEGLLTGILSKLFPKLSFTRTYFGYTTASVFEALQGEILRVWGDDVLLTYDQLAERLRYAPLERIKSTLAQHEDFIWNSVETFSHISRIEITDEERQLIHETTVQKCNAAGYASIADLPFDEIEERNSELSRTAIQNVVYRICLSDKFDKKGKIITRKGDVINALSIMKEYCRSIDKCSLDDLLAYEKELTGVVQRWIPMEVGNTVLVRIDKNTFLADKYFHFDTDIIDETIGLFVEGDYQPLKSFTTFGAFPDCGQAWNLFLLESYCRRFSRKFRFDTPSINSRNAGTVIRKSCDMTYMQILVDAVVNANVPLKAKTVSNFLYDSGYIGRRNIAKANEIIDKAKAIRERRD